MNEMVGASVLLDVTKIRMDGGTQARAELNEDTIAEYREVLKRAQKEGFDGTWPFPDVIVFYDGKDHWLADGFHRTAATQRAGWFKVSAEVFQGTRRDAVLYAVGANASHGLRRSQADKRRAVETLLRDEEWGQWSDREIARRCQVSHPLVALVRSQLEKVTGNFTSERTYTTKHGATAVMNTGNIGGGSSDPDKMSHQRYLTESELKGLALIFLEEKGNERLEPFMDSLGDYVFTEEAAEIGHSEALVLFRQKAKSPDTGRGRAFAYIFAGDSGYSQPVMGHLHDWRALSVPSEEWQKMYAARDFITRCVNIPYAVNGDRRDGWKEAATLAPSKVMELIAENRPAWMTDELIKATATLKLDNWDNPRFRWGRPSTYNQSTNQSTANSEQSTGNPPPGEQRPVPSPDAATFTAHIPITNPIPIADAEKYARYMAGEAYPPSPATNLNNYAPAVQTLLTAIRTLSPGQARELARMAKNMGIDEPKEVKNVWEDFSHLIKVWRNEKG